MPGYRFVKWVGVSNSTSPEITILPQSDAFLTAVFEPAELSVTNVVINEINYNSASSLDTEDWIELYNPSKETVSLSGWMLQDSQTNVFLFPENMVLKGDSYLIVCRDLIKFKAFYPNEQNLLGDLQFGISADGENLQLINAARDLVDEVTFSSTGAWDSLANGTGRTLSLRNPQLDNSLPQNWSASSLFGTPGKINDVYTKIEKEFSSLPPSEFALNQNYPNPFNPATTISWQLAVSSYVTLKIYDVLGNEVATLVNEEKQPGFYNYELGIRTYELPTGIYFYQLRAGSFVQTKKMILLK